MNATLSLCPKLVEPWRITYYVKCILVKRSFDLLFHLVCMDIPFHSGSQYEFKWKRDGDSK